MEQATVQNTELARKVKEFWNGLSPEEQARFDRALHQLVDNSQDVEGQGLTEYALILALIAIIAIAA
ncbi:MAG TPA: hypothetical protein VF221_09255 [Chloroflexota bacterium]